MNKTRRFKKGKVLNPQKYFSNIKAKSFAQKTPNGDGWFVNLPYKIFIAIALVLNLLVISFVFIFKNDLPPELPLYYGLPEGEEQLAPTIFLIIPSVVSISIMILNSGISLLVNNEFLKKTLIISFFIATFFSIIASIEIFLLVGNF